MKLTTWLVPAALLLSISGCSVVLPVLGYPPEALRPDPPPGVEAQSIATREPLPAGVENLKLESTQGPWSVSDERTHLVVFYRGHW